MKPLYFVAAVIGLWTAGRVAVLTWPEVPPPSAVAVPPGAIAPAASVPGSVRPITLAAVDRPAPAPVTPDLIRGPAAFSGRSRSGIPGQARDDVSREITPAQMGPAPIANPRREPVRTGAVDLATLASPPVAVARSRRLTAEAYLFYRPGSGAASIAANGQLGGSQAAARLAWALNPDGPTRFAVAARVYAPIDDAKGSEVAIGLDWHPLPAVPLRVSVERRIDVGGRGRDAWSAYAAGGFYKGGLPAGAVVDGYGQAGVVGVRARDLFVDGAVRVGRPISVARSTLTLGAGAWGAAQPGAARLDLGPRAALTIPAGRGSVTAAIEGRMRIAGEASPGSGVALTLATAF